MAITLGAGPFTDAGGGAATFDVVLTGLTAGRSLVVMLRWIEDVTISSATLSGETVVIHGSRTRDTTLPQSYQFLSVQKLASGSDRTLQITMSGTVQSTDEAWVHEVIGLDVDGAGGILNIEGGTTGNSANGNTSIVTTVDGCFILAGWTGNSGGDPSGVTAGYTQIALGNLSWWDEGAYNLDVGAAGSKTITFTHPSGVWIVKAAAFQPAAGGGSAPTAPYVNVSPLFILGMG